ncbi:MAG: cupin domain-containing protein [Cyclobacteriaceae bacterium]|nr:cupin domain-containing protein [Cyclobacteriaceae bacterium]
MKKANYWIDKLNLEKHPEGGYFREAYRSDENIEKGALPNRYNSDRSIATSIYFLLKGDDFSGFHRIQSDETWHFYLGTTLELFVLGDDGQLNCQLLGQNPEAGENFQITIPRNHWFGARVVDKNSYALLGCTVAPGFHFDDFELAEREDLIKLFPQHTLIIQELTMK